MAEEKPKRDSRKYRVVFTGITAANGELRRQGEILTAEEVGDVALHMNRGAIAPIAEAAKIETPKPPQGEK